MSAQGHRALAVNSVAPPLGIQARAPRGLSEVAALEPTPATRGHGR
ncbi:hypothetical protein SRB17_55040 [Streptomyces sp. RB17]|nr:hypothetical protein [Streptomyces sp. RB17]MQY37500.1 hypothetical protein [Streptomyces sp. RB17]